MTGEASQAMVGNTAPTVDQTAPEFAAKRMLYYAAFAHGHKDQIALHREAGQVTRAIVPLDEVGNKLADAKLIRWGDQSGGPVQHCMVEAAASRVLSERLGFNEQETLDFLDTAFVHDVFKRREIEEGKGVTDPNVIEGIFEKTKAMLLERGVSPRVVALTETVAHTSLPQFAYLDEENQIKLRDDIPLIDMAMHYLDDITAGTKIVAFDERMDYLDRVAAERYPYNEEGRAIWGGRTFFEAQREVGHLVEARLAEKAGVDDPKRLPHIINEQLLADINAFGDAA